MCPHPLWGTWCSCGLTLPHRPSHMHSHMHHSPFYLVLARSLHPSKLHLLRLPCLEAGTQWALTEQRCSSPEHYLLRRSQGPSLLAGWDSLLSVQCESRWLTCAHRYARLLSVTAEKGAPGPSVGSLFPLQHATWVTKCPFIQVSTKLHPNWSLSDSLWGEAAQNARGSPTLSLGFKDGAINPRMNPWQSSPGLHS